MIRIGSRKRTERAVEDQLRAWADKLHDLSGRNRLLYYRETGGSSAEIEHPGFRDLFQRLVERGQTLVVPLPRVSEAAWQTAAEPGKDLGELQELLPEEGGDGPLEAELVPGARSAGDFGSLAMHDTAPNASDLNTESAVSRGIKRRGSAPPKPNEVRTNRSPAQLSRVLYNLRYAARTIEEEQGLNILYVTFGMLRWRELRDAAYHQAPLILVPVRLNRDRPNLPYKIQLADDDIVVNPPLQVMLQKEFGLQLPEVGNDLTGGQLKDFLEAAREQVSGLEGWEIEEKATLGAFSFLSLLLIKDFENYAEQYARHPLIRWLVGIEPSPAPTADLPPPAEDLDRVVDPSTVFQILDADSSQQEAIEAAKRGLSFIIQGPPGTGKSQTIANLIAETIMAGKRVLFVSQKLAALEVVQHRLARKGLAEFCLEIHSHKMDKSKVVGELMESLATDTVRLENPEYAARQGEMSRVREELNAYVRELHEPRGALGLSLYELHGRLSQVLDAPDLQFSLDAPEEIPPARLGEILNIVRELSGYRRILESYSDNIWRGFGGLEASLQSREGLSKTLMAAGQAISALHAKITESLERFGLRPAESLQEEIELAQALGFFRTEILAPTYEGVVLRFRGHGLPDGRFLSIQYGSDADKLRDLLHSDQQPTTRDISISMATLAQTIQKGRDRESAGAALPVAGDDYPDWTRLLEATEQGYAAARELFRSDEMPRVLSELYQQPPLDLANWFIEHAERSGELQDWANFNVVVEAANQRGLGDYVRVALAAGLEPEVLEDSFKRRFYQLLIDRILSRIPTLQRFNGESHTARIRRFRNLDLAMIEESASEIRARLYKRKPPRSWMNAQSAETSILRREYNKRRRLKPLRRLFAEIPTLVQTLKPCLMMSPLTVCQLLDPSIYQFDLVVFDEASQIPPEYAVSAFLRSKQAVVAGDRQQLPPTNFFQTMEGEEPEEDETGAEGEFESILNLCDSRGFPNKLLNWHYRSRDESLIAYSNHHFYENRLHTFPNSRHANPGTGLKYVFVEDGVYFPGEGARYNLREATKVAAIALVHMIERPELSLGIVAFSAPQRRAIESAIEKLRPQYRVPTDRVEAMRAEPLFVKNLENVQGDERDVIILSVGYGRDSNGRFAMNFGPLNRDGGARRLNVAVTRARTLLYLVSSIQPEDIDLSRAASRGAALLRDYLLTARDGVAALLREDEGMQDGEAPSLFESVVHAELSRRGLDLARRVGASQYRIDLAVRDPREHDRYLLGLECDGTMYRSALTARDRDRLREQVLADLGWKIHRIWSPEWIRDRDAQVERVLELVDSLKDSPSARAPKPVPDPTPRAMPKESMREETPAAFPASASVYTAAELPRTQTSGKQSLMRSALSAIIDGVQELTNAEGPIAAEAAKRAIARSWGTRLDREISGRIDDAITSGIRQGAFRRNGNFLWPIGLQVAPLRVHAAGGDRRSIEEIAPEEIAAAMRECVKAAVTLEPEDLIRQTAKLFGLKVSVQNTTALKRVMKNLLREGVLVESGGRIGRGSNYQPSPATKPGALRG